MDMPEKTPALEPVMLEAEPGDLEIDLQRTAVVVIDMQNTFVSKGGVLDLIGLDISGCTRAVKQAGKVNDAARARGVRIIYVVHHYSSDLRETGGPNSGNWHSRGMMTYREHPEWRDRFFIKGTWGAEIVQDLKPKEDEVVVVKPRYSAFFGTDLDAILRTFNLKYLAFTGVDTAICVESAIRDASYLDYFPIIVSDATASAGPSFTQEATLFNVKRCFGWVTNTENLIRAFTN
jgi:ureidoacrylate peracid hydrolase